MTTLYQPKIYTIQDDLLNTQDSLVAHCCNTQNTMGAGVAKALRDRFPEVYVEDTAAYIRHGKELLGKSVIVPVVTDPDKTNIKYIANLYGQPNYGYVGRHVDYEALYQSFEQLAGQVRQMVDITSISMPHKIASDRAGGDWNIVRAMIDSAFANQSLTIKFYQL